MNLFDNKTKDSKLTDIFSTKHSRDYYRGKSFNFAGEWAVNNHYISDDYRVDFVTYKDTLLSCKKSHLSDVTLEPSDFIYDEDSGKTIGIVSEYWEFVLSGLNEEILNNYVLIEDLPVEKGSGKNSVQQKGTGAASTAKNAVALGEGTQAIGVNAVAEGYHTIAGKQTSGTGGGNHAEGVNTRAIANKAAHAEGYQTIAIGDNAHAEGGSSTNDNEIALNPNSTPEQIISAWNSNKFLLAKGSNAHAEGSNTLALNNHAHSEGSMTIAKGYQSHAEGLTTQANGGASHAEGDSCIANGSRSHAEGYGTLTNNIAEHAEGQWNKSNPNTIHSVGIGTSESNRKNAFEITKDGDIYVYGLGTYRGTDLNNAKPLQYVVDTKYVKPENGIPASDIEDGVIPDVSQFVTKSVNDLTNYYLKSDTYTKEEVLALIAGIGQFVYVVADILPSASADTMGKIYLVPSSDPQVQNTKDEFITIENNGVYSWEQIGSTTIDLSGYVTTQELNTALANYTTSAELTTLLDAKYEKPSAGIPKSDLSSSAQSSLNKADTAYQKPSTGIPATDMTASVRGSLELANSSVTLNEYTIYVEQGLLLDVRGNSYLVRIGDGFTDAIYLISCEDDYTNTRVNELTSYFDLDIGFYLCSPGRLLFWASSTTKFSIISLRENGAIDAEIIDEKPVGAEEIFPERYATDSELAHKQDIISDLSNIRSGAAAGASAVQPSAIAHMESTDNKVTSLSSASTDQQYPSAKAVVDSLGKWGVVSQTQTWTGGASTGYDYTMSNQVWGLIPQTFIDEAKVYGAVFNENTGYFEVSGLTDVSYKEMIVINSTYATKFDFSWSGGLYYRSLPTRTIFPMNNGSYINISWSFHQNHNIESIYAPSMLHANNLQSAFGNCVHLKHIGNIVVLNLTTEANITNAFKNCRSLETCLLYNLKVSVDFGQSPRLKLDTIVYIVQNAANTTAITITLHATAYARMQADTTEYTYNGQTYVGIIAYANAKNITIASA